MIIFVACDCPKCDTRLNMSQLQLENKYDINKKKANTTATTTTEFFKSYKNSTFFDAQNAGNRISGLLDFNFFWGACHQTPLGEGGLTASLVVTAAYYTSNGCL